MSTCIDCSLVMATAKGCTRTELIIHGSPFVRRRHGGNRCGGCGAKRGGVHHLGCDLERCPRCRRQLLSCGCLDDPDDGVDDDEHE